MVKDYIGSEGHILLRGPNIVYINTNLMNICHKGNSGFASHGKCSEPLLTWFYLPLQACFLR